MGVRIAKSGEDKAVAGFYFLHVLRAALGFRSRVVGHGAETLYFVALHEQIGVLQHLQFLHVGARHAAHLFGQNLHQAFDMGNG